MTSTDGKEDPDEDGEDDESRWAGCWRRASIFPGNFHRSMGCLLVATGTAFIAFEKQPSYTAEEAKLASWVISQEPTATARAGG